jgi:hypothetical protein
MATAKTTPAPRTIKKFDILSIAKFFAVIGFVWGFLSGVILLATYIQGYSTTGDVSVLLQGLTSFGLMIVYGVMGGVIGGTLIAFMYNAVLGAKHGIRMELD